jgi:hypothetical protein
MPLSQLARLSQWQPHNALCRMLYAERVLQYTHREVQLWESLNNSFYWIHAMCETQFPIAIKCPTMTTACSAMNKKLNYWQRDL